MESIIVLSEGKLILCTLDYGLAHQVAYRAQLRNFSDTPGLLFYLSYIKNHCLIPVYAYQ